MVKFKLPAAFTIWKPGALIFCRRNSTRCPDLRAGLQPVRASAVFTAKIMAFLQLKLGGLTNFCYISNEMVGLLKPTDGPAEKIFLENRNHQ
jgi:hypothetical protein